MTFTGTIASMPKGMSFKARLAWKFFFDGGWAIVRVENGEYVVTDEGMDLTTATVFPDEDALISWLDTVTTEHLEGNRIGFLSLFCSIPELITDTVAREIEKVVNEAPE